MKRFQTLHNRLRGSAHKLQVQALYKVLQGLYSHLD